MAKIVYYQTIYGGKKVIIFMDDDSCLYRERNNVYFICIHPLSPSTHYGNCFHQINDNIGIDKKKNKITLQRGRRTSAWIIVIQKKNQNFFLDFIIFPKELLSRPNEKYPKPCTVSLNRRTIVVPIIA